MGRQENVRSRDELLYLAAGAADLVAEGLRGLGRRVGGAVVGVR